MALRAGSYNAARPDWRGVIRWRSSGWARCLHHHANQPEATKCGVEALSIYNAENQLPSGWESLEHEEAV